MNDQQYMDELRRQIAQMVVKREALKTALEKGELSQRSGLRELVEIDNRLSGLDSEFKTLWDRHNSGSAPVD